MFFTNVTYAYVMPKKVFETIVKAPVQQVWDFHNRPDAFRLLTPPEENIQILTKDMTLRKGAIHEFVTKQFGMKVRWKARLTEVTPPNRFIDEAIKSPFKSWKHTHEFEDIEGDTIIRDIIEYEAPGWIFRNLIDQLFINDKINNLIRFRHHNFHDLLESHKAEINDALFEKTEIEEDSSFIS